MEQAPNKQLNDVQKHLHSTTADIAERIDRANPGLFMQAILADYQSLVNLLQAELISRRISDQHINNIDVAITEVMNMKVPSSDSEDPSHKWTKNTPKSVKQYVMDEFEKIETSRQNILNILMRIEQ